MSEVLGACFHWSPRSRRRAILQSGLVPYANPSLDSVSMPWVCLGFTPSAAWAYSGVLRDPEEVWDLWQVRLVDGDEVHIRAEFSPVLKELRVHNAIPADRVWWAAQRVALAGDGIVPGISKPRVLRLRPSRLPPVRLTAAADGESLAVQLGQGKSVKRSVLDIGMVEAIREWL